MEEDFIAAPFSAINLGSLDLLYSQKGMVKIEWTLSDGTAGKNHYLYGTPAFDLNKYKEWFKKL